MTASEIQMRVAKADEVRAQKQQVLLQPMLDHVARIMNQNGMGVQGFPTLAEMDERQLEHAATELQTTVPEAVSALARQISTGRSLGKTRTINALLTPKVAVTKEMKTAGEEAATLAELGTVFACSKPEATSFPQDEPMRLAAPDARAPRLISNSAEADRVNLLWEKGLLWEDGSGKLSADPPAPKPSRLRELLQRKASSVGVPESQVRMLMSDKLGDIPYHGPTKPAVDSDGNPTGRRETVPDEVHERFHKALGDVATGGVMRPARDQMEKALADAKAKDGKAPQPIRGITRSGDPRIGGWHG